MTKSELTNIVSKKVRLTRKATEETVEAVFDEVVRSLLKGEKVVISNFGTFYVNKVKDKTVVPFGQNEKKQTIKGHNVINFRVGKNLKKEIW